MATHLDLIYVEPPRYCRPMNAVGGLYMKVRCPTGRASAEDLLSFVRADVIAAGYDPDGDGFCTLPTVAGVVARSYALWFYDRVGKAHNTGEVPAITQSRYVRLPNGNIVVVGDENFISVKVEVDLSEIIDSDLKGFLALLSEKATGSCLMSYINYSVSRSYGSTLEISVIGSIERLKVEDVDIDSLPMAIFDVEVTRVSYGSRTVRLSAKTREDALDTAADDAGNHTYSECTSEYTFDVQQA
ncbi:hypothetical protein [Burkholderia cepacia]|uniref:hypothetical protein n=1 Tax=Burkholderia cepacia TaxID=292 RepID=UPI002AB7A8FC|nr:hypothetical protein [Burkholderia cepacia]